MSLTEPFRSGEKKKRGFRLPSYRVFLVFFSLCFLTLLAYRFTFKFGDYYIHNDSVYYHYALPFLLMSVFFLFGVLPRTLQINLFVLLVTWLSLEWAFSHISKEEVHIDTKWIPTKTGEKLTRQSEIAGYEPRPDVSGRAIKKINGKPVYSALYSIDSHGRRNVPIENKEARDFLIFFGGSRTFGHGVSDNETIPYFVGEAMSQYQVYSYSFRGWGPAQFLSILESRDLSEEIDEPRGVVVTLMIVGHIKRTIGSYRISTQYNGGYIPNYTYDKNGPTPI